MKARFLEEQPPVRVVETEESYFVFICLNAERKTEIHDDQETEYIEYDYAELHLKKGEADMEDIRADPENYLNYTSPKEKTLEDTVKEQEETIQMLTECLLEMSEAVYA